MSLEPQILEQLDNLHGNCNAVAEALMISPDYVRKIKRTKWSGNGSTPAIIAPSTPSAIVPRGDMMDIINSVVPPNFSGIAGLRDDIILKLHAKLPEASITELESLLDKLLKFEKDTRDSLRPVVGAVIDARQDNRSVHIGDLVEKMSNVTPAELAQLAGVSEVIEGEITDGE